jgi:two-component system cell cycle response regulator
MDNEFPSLLKSENELPGTKKKVLIVDDEETYLHLLTMIMSKNQYDVIRALDGRRAWEIVQQEQVSFVISDWMMPEMDGLELTQRIRAANFPNYTYIILLTARSSKEDVVDGLKAGADDYLTKPFHLNELRARVAIGERILNLETRLRQTLDQLYLLATHDSLTGLLNRRALYDYADSEINRSKREKNPLCLIMVDIDHFKNVNDQFGHLVGDQALRLISHTIEQNKRSYDRVGRWGGEEFLLVLPGTMLQEAIQVAERLRRAIENAVLDLSGENAVRLSASFGVASLQLDSNENFEQMIHKADQALYSAKNAGRNQVQSFPKSSD